MFALALAVGLTPELLPMIVTVTLARSALEMSKRKVIVKRLTAIHDLGAMNVLCTDKTGTLTEATIKLMRAIDGLGAESEPCCQRVHQQPVRDRDEESTRSGNPFRPSVRYGRVEEDRRGTIRFRATARLGPGRARRRASFDRQGCAGGSPAAVGALRGCGRQGLPLDSETRRCFEATLDGLGAQGFRALGIASRVVDTSHQTAAVSDESDLVFSGFAVFLDPPKASAGATIQAMTTAGISVKVLTGDNELVTRHVFAEIGVPVTECYGRRADKPLGRGADRAIARVNLFCESIRSRSFGYC